MTTNGIDNGVLKGNVPHQINTVTIIGAGNGGKAAAADLSLQGVRVRLCEMPDFAENLTPIIKTKTIHATGAIEGAARLDQVTFDPVEALDGADTVMICTQALTHKWLAKALATLVTPDQLVVLNPGSTGGSLYFAHIFRCQGIKTLPVFAETSTLTYGCRADGDTVNVAVKVNRVVFGTFPATAMTTVGPSLESLFPGLVRAGTVLEAGLHNANPVIHPPITLLNAALIEREGSAGRFYADGVSPAVAALIEKLDRERMALMDALGYPCQPDPVTSKAQGYADSEDYYRCYRYGPGFSNFTFPDTLDNRYFHEDIGMGLVFFVSLGELLGVPTPACRAVIAMGSIIAGVDYLGKGRKTLKTLGLGNITKKRLKTYLMTGHV